MHVILILNVCFLHLCRSVLLRWLSTQPICVSWSPRRWENEKTLILWRAEAVWEVHAVEWDIFIFGRSAYEVSPTATWNTHAHKHAHNTLWWAGLTLSQMHRGGLQDGLDCVQSVVSLRGTRDGLTCCRAPLQRPAWRPLRSPRLYIRTPGRV